LNYQDDDDDDDDGTSVVPESPRDALRRWRYTLSPTLYVDENSTVPDLLWQQVLEQRAQRGWLITIFVVLALLVVVVVTFTLIVAATR
jgi:hypothetical protein